MVDRTNDVVKAMVARLSAVSGVTDLVGTRVYDQPPQDVAFPYIRIENASAVPFDAEALRGRETIFRVTAYSRAVGRVECRQIMAAVDEALHWYDLAFEPVVMADWATLAGLPRLADGVVVSCRVTGARDFKGPDDVTTIGPVDVTVLTHG